MASRLLKGENPPGIVRSVPAGEIEAAVIDHVRGLLRAPEIIVATWREAHKLDEAISENEVREALQDMDPIWDELFPYAQARVLQLLVERVEVHPSGLEIKFRMDGLETLVAEIRESLKNREAA